MTELYNQLTKEQQAIVKKIPGEYRLDYMQAVIK